MFPLVTSNSNTQHTIHNTSDYKRLHWCKLINHIIKAETEMLTLVCCAVLFSSLLFSWLSLGCFNFFHKCFRHLSTRFNWYIYLNILDIIRNINIICCFVCPFVCYLWCFCVVGTEREYRENRKLWSNLVLVLRSDT